MPHAENRPGIDGIRGFAILFTMSVHVRNLTEGSAPGWVQGFAAMGGTAVYLFFAVSGYLLFHTSAARERHRPFSPREFLIRRAIRILPLWWILVSIVWWWKGLELPVAISQYFFWFGFMLYDSRWFPIPISWSLFAEEVLYLFFPIFFLGIRTLRSSLVAWAISTALGIGFVVAGRALGWPEENYYLFRSPIYVAQFFFLGVALWHGLGHGTGHEQVLADPGDTPMLRSIRASGLHLDMLALLFFAGLWVDRNIFLVPHIVTVFLCAHTHASRVGRVLHCAWIRSFGRSCYSIYLFHFLVVDLLARIQPWPAVGGTALFAIHYLTVATASWLVGFVGHRLVESPMQKWANGLFRGGDMQACRR
ncbi:MAG: acyltransferase [Bdellovibrionales bacterium]|nr:acyltransferase [Bdellovibrionales bacterium]